MAVDLRTRRQILSASAFGAAVVITIAFYLLFPPAKVERTLFFPGAIVRSLAGEVRLVPRTADRREALRLLVEELILGPVSIESTRALPIGTEVNLVAVRDDTVYVDLSEEVVLDGDDLNLTFDERIGALEHSLLFNFRDIERVVVTVGGHALYAPHHFSPESRN